MIVDSIALSDFQVFSKIDRDLNKANTELQEFYKWQPTIDTFSKIIAARSYPIDRTVLNDVLKEQYQFLGLLEGNEARIGSIQDSNSFTICTAHQSSLFGGPGFVISKALSAIKLAQQLQEKNQTCKIIPFFVIGSEDHDTDELNHTYVNGTRITWDTIQKGPVGRFNLDGIDGCINELKILIQNTPFEKELTSLIESAYKPENTFAQAFQYLLIQLLSSYGLLVLNTDHPVLKKRFSSFIKQELLHSSSKALVTETQSLLDRKGYSPAAYARDINVFYFDDGFRERIEKENGSYKIFGIQKEVNADDFILEAEEHPERFSPNVVMRPLYQEVILPNLAYVGGGGELAYWLERKHQFEAMNVPYPMLVRRDSFIIITAEDYKLMQEFQMTMKDLDERTDVLINNLAERWSKSDLDLNNEEIEILKWFDQIKTKAIEIDSTLGATVEGEKSKLSKSIEYIEKKLLKAEKLKLEVRLNKARKLKDRLMPDGNLLERKENFMTYYSMYGPRFFNVLLEDFNPLAFQFKMIEI
ncbi:MAG: bacillithiol biosynthesis cysteine-adding enzyme BshC [Saprospiraceae bacterium]